MKYENKYQSGRLQSLRAVVFTQMLMPRADWIYNIHRGGTWKCWNKNRGLGHFRCGESFCLDSAGDTVSFCRKDGWT